MPTAAVLDIPAVAPRTLADALLPRPASVSRARVADAVLIVAASLSVALAARVEIVLPWTPVPITGQTFAVLLAGLLLGPRRGAAAMALYLLEGACGLPVFAGGVAGVAKLFGPTGGYLCAYPLAAALSGWLASARGWDRRPATAAAAMGVGSLLVLTLGSLWLSLFVGGVGAGFTRGMLPFLPGDVVKLAAAAALLPGGWALVRRVRGEENGAGR